MYMFLILRIYVFNFKDFCVFSRCYGFLFLYLRWYRVVKMVVWVCGILYRLARFKGMFWFWGVGLVCCGV